MSLCRRLRAGTHCPTGVPVRRSRGRCCRARGPQLSAASVLVALAEACRSGDIMFCMHFRGISSPGGPEPRSHSAPARPRPRPRKEGLCGVLAWGTREGTPGPSQALRWWRVWPCESDRSIICKASTLSLFLIRNYVLLDSSTCRIRNSTMR